LAGCNIRNSLHETSGKYENLNSIKSHLHIHHATYYSCSYVVNFIHEYFMETDLHLQISQHQAGLKHKNFTVSYHSYPTFRGVARGGMGAIAPPIPKVALAIFRLIKVLMCKPKKCVSTNQRNCLKKLFYFNFWSKLIKAVWFINSSRLIKYCV